MPEYENHISKTVNPMKPKFENEAEKTTCTSWMGHLYPQTQFNMADGRHLDNLYDVITLPRMI